MTLYSIYAKPEKGPDALSVLGEKFSWAAFFFAPLWALTRGAFAYLALWIVIIAALVWTEPAIGTPATLALYAVFALWTGFAAPQIAGKALRHRDWMMRGELAASDAVAAERLWLERIYGAGA